MNERPFYELDDEELILAEANEAALSDSQLPYIGKKTVGSNPGLVLYAPMAAQVLVRLQTLAKTKAPLTILDHAQIVNACACTVDRNGSDRFGLQALFRSENALLQLDRVAPGLSPRSLAPYGVIEGLAAVEPTDHKEAADGWARRLTANELLAIGQLAEEPNHFLATRRLGLALLPSLTRATSTADALREYIFALRILVNGIAARWSLLPWQELRMHHADDADTTARAMIVALQNEHALG